MLAKIKFQRLKQDQLKLEKKKAKLRGKKKLCGVVSLKSKNKVSLKKIWDERKDSDLATGEKNSIEVESREKKIRMKKKECRKYR